MVVMGVPMPAGPDAEKITINLGYVDLGHIDLLVQEGFYANRTDFIRTAIRNQVERHADAARQSVQRKNLDLGLRHYSRADLEAVLAAGRMLDIRVLGLAQHRPGRHSRPRPRHHCCRLRAGRASRLAGGEGRPGRPHPLSAAPRPEHPLGRSHWPGYRKASS
jgi:Arc/MetJ-type ribon-helix-helix transcriptional regulator